MPHGLTKFSHGEDGLTRFPPNVEQLTVVHESRRTWLVARRNDVELRFPLEDEDCEHLAGLLMRFAQARSSLKAAG